MFQRTFLLTFFVLIIQTLAQSGFDTLECGKTKHCISFPSNCHEDSTKQCQYMISHSPFMDGKSVIIELFGERVVPGTQYVALGFSEDAFMGEEPVVACVTNPNGQPLLMHSYNQGKSNHPNVGVDKSDGELIESIVTEKVIYCKFRQAITPTNDALPNLNNQYQTLVARGPRKSDGQIGYHSDRQAIPLLTNFIAPSPMSPPTNRHEPDEMDIIPSVAPSVPGLVVFPNETRSMGNNNGDHSNDMLPEERGDPVVDPPPPAARPVPAAKGSGPFSLTSATKLMLVRYHGFLMLVAWFGMIAIGIFSARYLRPGTPNTKVGGLHLWFQLHRLINFSAILIMIAASVLIFIGKDLGWTGPILGAGPEYNWNPGAIHTVFGVMAIILALMQPLGALARCAPEHPRRPIFNWGHRLLGIIAIIFALIATFIAINKFGALWTTVDTPTMIIIIYIVAAFLLIIVLEAFSFTRSRSRRKVTINNGMELQNRSKNSYDGFDSTYHSSHERTSKDKLVDVSGFLLFAAISILFVVLVSLLLL